MCLGWTLPGGLFIVSDTVTGRVGQSNLRLSCLDLVLIHPIRLPALDRAYVRSRPYRLWYLCGFQLGSSVYPLSQQLD